jgi:serine kinase of HPr protein (carbohydrate metabolism regulator)
MSDAHPPILHATGIVIGTTGIAVTGPSGSGKSMTALNLLASARRAGLFARLVADDWLLLEHSVQGAVIMRAPPQIAGRMELRGTAIATMHHMDAAVLHLVLAPGEPQGEDRIPPEAETLEIMQGVRLPVVRLLYRAQGNPLATLEVIRPVL